MYKCRLTEARGQAKDKEQAVLYLYRVYGLHAVKHENLRPEKPPKPFPRMIKEQAAAAAIAQGEREGEEGEEAEVGEEGGSPSKRRTRAGTKARKVKAKGKADAGAEVTAEEIAGAEVTAEEMESVETGVAEEPKDVEDAVDVEPAPKKRRGANAHPQKSLSPRKPRTSKRGRGRGRGGATGRSVAGAETETEAVVGMEVETETATEVVREVQPPH